MFPLRGRQQELKLLLDAFRDVLAGATRFVMIAGEPGAGKTRLTQELYAELTRNYDPPTSGFSEGYWPDLLKPGFAQDTLVPPLPDNVAKRPPMPYFWWALVCRQGNQTQRESFQPFADGMEQLSAHLLAQLRNVLVREAWGEVTHGLVFGAMEYLPLVGPLLKGIYNPVRSLNSRLRKLREPAKLDEKTLRDGGSAGGLEEVLIQVIAALNNPADKRLPQIPLCLMLDDAQWADARSIAFTQRLVELAVERKWRLLVVLTARRNELAAQMEDSAGAPAGLASTAGELVRGLIRRVHPKTVVQIDLAAELPEPDMRCLLHDHLPQASEETIGELLGRVGGHPYFAVNYARLVEEEGWLDEAGGWAAGSEVLSEVPEEISAVIDRRLNLLDSHRRRVLNWGSVQGWRFIDTLVEQVAARFGQQPAEALKELDGLQKSHSLVSPLPPPPEEEQLYQFAHRLIYERVRQDFSPDLQEYKVVRATLGELLREHLQAGWLADWPAEELLHCLEFLHTYAIERTQAVREEDRNGWDEVRLMSAVQLLQVLHSRGDNLSAEPIALETWQRLTTKDPGPVARDLEFQLLEALAAVFDVRAKWDEWEACNSRRLVLSHQAGNTEGEIAALLDMAELASMRGRFEDALVLYDQVIAAVENAEDPTLRADALIGKARVLMFRSDFDLAIELFERARGIYKAAGDELGELTGIEGLADAHRARVEIEEAAALCREALEGYRRLGEDRAAARILRCLGVLHLQREELDPAEELLTQCLELERRVGAESGMNETLRNLALIMVRRGDFERAIDMIRQSLEVARRLGDRHCEARNLQSLGTTYMRLKRFEEGLEYMQQAQELYTELGDWHTACMTLTNIGMIHSHYRRDAQALEHYQRAEQIFREAGDEYHVAFAQSCQSWALICLRRFDEAIATAKRALEVENEPVSSFNIALAKWLRGDPDAIERYREVIERFGGAPEPDALREVSDRGLASREDVEELIATLQVMSTAA